MPCLLRLLVHVCTITVGKRPYIVILFSETMNQIVFEMRLSYLLNMPIYFPSGKVTFLLAFCFGWQKLHSRSLPAIN